MKKRIICFISAFALMALTFCINAFATIPINSTDDVQTIINTAFEEKGMNRDDYYCFVYGFDNENDKMPYRLSYLVCYFNKNEFDEKDCTISIADLPNFIHSAVMCFKPNDIIDFGSINVTQMVKDDSFTLGAASNLSLFKSKYYAYELSFFYWNETQILYTDIPIYKGVYDSSNGLTDDGLSNGESWSPSNNIKPPFTVEYYPSLGENMERKAELVAPGSPNDGQIIESNTLTVKIKLTDNFLNIDKNYSLSALDSMFFGKSTYNCMIYLTTENPTNENFSSMIKQPFYTHLNYGYYINDKTETDIDGDNGNMVDYVETRAKGITPIWHIDRDTKSVTSTITLSDIDFSKLMNNELYLCVTGVFNTNSHGQEDKLQVGNYGVKNEFYSTNFTTLSKSDVKTFYSASDDGEVSSLSIAYYKYYTVVSNKFSYTDYPQFSGGQTFNIDGENHQINSTMQNIDDLLDIPYNKITDNDIINNGGSEMTSDEYKNYLDNKSWGENFNNDFGIGSITDLLNGTSTFYGFLTACISILPSWFMTILASFFVVLLSLVVVKFVVS